MAVRDISVTYPAQEQRDVSIEIEPSAGKSYSEQSAVGVRLHSTSESGQLSGEVSVHLLDTSHVNFRRVDQEYLNNLKERIRVNGFRNVMPLELVEIKDEERVRAFGERISSRVMREAVLAKEVEC